eukprot:Sspe_Gene.120067::Locus_117739_Transcript_1_5_Confidence_0.375_Length_1010::g.120067::m.120067
MHGRGRVHSKGTATLTEAIKEMLGRTACPGFTGVEGMPEPGATTLSEAIINLLGKAGYDGYVATLPSTLYRGRSSTRLREEILQQRRVPTPSFPHRHMPTFVRDAILCAAALSITSVSAATSRQWRRPQPPPQPPRASPLPSYTRYGFEKRRIPKSFPSTSAHTSTHSTAEEAAAAGAGAAPPPRPHPPAGFSDHPVKRYYAVLGASPFSSEEALRKLYRKACLLHHPDKHVAAAPEKQQEEAAAFKHVCEAYQVLSDRRRREAYNRLCRAYSK